MSDSNGNVWKPRKPEEFICPSGQKVLTRQPGPEFTLRLGKTTRSFTTPEGVPKRREGQSDEEYGREVLDQISDDDLTQSARELLVAMCVSPKLSLNPDYDKGELHPDDTGIDFWPLYQHGMQKYYSRKGKVQVGDGEVEVNDLETFREEQGVSGDSVDSTHVSPNTEQPNGDQGLVNSAGA